MTVSFVVFFFNYNALQKLSKLLWGEEDEFTPEGEVKRGRLRNERVGEGCFSFTG